MPNQRPEGIEMWKKWYNTLNTNSYAASLQPVDRKSNPYQKYVKCRKRKEKQKREK